MSVPITLPPIPDRRTSPFYIVAGKDKTPGNNMLRMTAGFNLTVPNHWEVARAKIKYVADANAANRQVYLYTQDGDGILQYQLDYVITPAITANQTKQILLNHAGIFSNIYMDSDAWYLTLRRNSWFFHGNQFLMLGANNFQAGDKITYHIEMRWLNWELGMDPPVIPGLDDKPVQKKSTCKWF